MTSQTSDAPAAVDALPVATERTPQERLSAELKPGEFVTVYDSGDWKYESASGNTYTGAWGYDDDGVIVLDCGCRRWWSHGRKGEPCRHARAVALATLLLRELPQPDESLSRGQASLCHECGTVRLAATCEPVGTMIGIRRVRCGCVAEIVRGK